MAEIIPIAADHAGFDMKERRVAELQAFGYEPLDRGTHTAAATDYPPCGILLCGSGEIRHTFPDTPFAGGRHARRVAGIDAEAAS